MLPAECFEGIGTPATPPPRPFRVSCWPAGVLAVSDDDRAFDKLGLGNDTNNGNDDDRGGRAKHHVLSAPDRHCIGV